ncbi:hypothetical protein Taro_001804 [Colocasia esculenta]|uniref:Uncharacterized protein n=1 Tax=Colocasia esculenta TaxID=4460 RepID=A0A843TFN7_COLES|nr:hypothetical protein [Colocasia esculenta]
MSPSAWRQPRRRNPTDLIATRPLSLPGRCSGTDIRTGTGKTGRRRRPPCRHQGGDIDAVTFRSS